MGNNDKRFLAKLLLKQRKLENETNKKITGIFEETLKKHFNK